MSCPVLEETCHRWQTGSDETLRSRTTGPVLSSVDQSHGLVLDRIDYWKVERFTYWSPVQMAEGDLHLPE